MSENMYAIPLSTGAQQFTIKLGENALQIRLVWREAQGGGWFMDLADTAGTCRSGPALRSRSAGRVRSSGLGKNDRFP